jgi:hypothetical protein
MTIRRQTTEYGLTFDCTFRNLIYSDWKYTAGET